jgi:hypothetical protein
MRLLKLLKFLLKHPEYKIDVFNNEKHISDGYHTIEEVYYQRMLYNAAFINKIARNNNNVVKSTRHSDGELCFDGGYFIVVMELPTGQISNHYEMKYWNLFKCKHAYKAPAWDGHDSRTANGRLFDYVISNTFYVDDAPTANMS